MKFSSHEERKQHPLAGMIPDYMWNRYFNHGIDDKLLKLMSLSEEELCKEVIDLFRNSTDEANCFAFAAPESSCTATYTAVQRAATPRTSLSSESFERSLMKVELGADEETKIFLAILFSHKDLSKNTLNIIINKVGIDCERAFSVAAEFGLIEILQSLEDLFPDKLQDMIKAENYSAFRFAAKNGQVNVLEYLERKIQPPATLQDMIKANNYKAIPYHAFLLAAENGQVKVLEYLESKIKPPATLQDMINQYTYVVFSKAARGGRVDVLKYLESKIQPPATLQDMIKANNYAAFYFAAKNGHLEVLEYLETKIQPPATLH